MLEETFHALKMQCWFVLTRHAMREIFHAMRYTVWKINFSCFEKVEELFGFVKYNFNRCWRLLKVNIISMQ